MIRSALAPAALLLLAVLSGGPSGRDAAASDEKGAGHPPAPVVVPIEPGLEAFATAMPHLGPLHGRISALELARLANLPATPRRGMPPEVPQEEPPAAR